MSSYLLSLFINFKTMNVNIFYKGWFIFSLIILLTDCTSTKNMNNLKNENVIIELEKTSCMGTCPVYTLQIMDNGIVLLNAKENLDMIGSYKSRLTKTELISLVNEFDESNFFDFKDSYMSMMKDLPTSFISYTKDESTKRIKAYHNIPKNLGALIRKVDQLTKALEWETIK